MGTPFLSEVRIVSFNFAPKGWAFCNGQTLPINQNQALFALIGTYYGGNGTTTFQLPNLQGRVPVHQGSGFSVGQQGGEAAVTLTTAELPIHTHQASGVSNTANLTGPTGNTWADSVNEPYAPSPGVGMNANIVTQTGGGQSHNNLSPYLVLSYVIALQGIFPSQN